MQGAGYGLYAMFGGPNEKPSEERLNERLEAVPKIAEDRPNYTAVHLVHLQAEHERKREQQELQEIFARKFRRHRRRR